MRSRAISIECKFPLPFDEPDCNGVVYSKSAWDNVYTAVGKPIVNTDKNGDSVIIGFITEATVVDKCLVVKGTCFHGGTSESVCFDEDNAVCSVEIESVGITL